VLLLLLFAVIILKGQTQLYGQIDTTDLKLTSCDFEKGANAMVLFDKTEVNTEFLLTTVTRHIRIKILNDKGLNAANIAIEYYSKGNLQRIGNIEAQTINLDQKQIKFTQLDPSLIYKQAENKYIRKKRL